MITRRQFIKTAVLAGGAMATSGCGTAGGGTAYNQAVQQTWMLPGGHAPLDGSSLHELVHAAILAPSSHNTQCWRFKLGSGAISILPDFSRRCPVVDPDDHHLFVSLGCAAENMVHAALAAGLHATTSYRHDGEGGIQLLLEKTKPVRSPLFDAIPKRQSTRTEYDGRPVTREDLRLLEQAGMGQGVRVILIDDKQLMERVLGYVVEGNTAQMRDAAFVAELKSWIRFSDSEAVRSGDGLFSRCSGNPAAPRWLGSLLFSMFFKEGTENDKYARQVRSSAGIAVFVSDADDRLHWVEAGRAFERFSLQATALGIRSAHLNQPVEVPSIRPQLASALNIKSGRPDLVVRFGRGPEMPRSLRRPVESVIV